MSMLSKLKQFKDLRSQAKTLQDTLSHESVSVSEVGGKIKLSMDGNMKITTLDIDAIWLAPGNKAVIEKGVCAAFEDATKKIQRVMATKMKEMGGLKFPGME